MEKTLKTTDNDSAVEIQNSDEKPSSALANNSLAIVEKIGNISPVQDFEAMLSHRDNPDWVSKAIKGLKSKILELVEDSVAGNNYDKAVECLVALRKGCVLEQVCAFELPSKIGKGFLVIAFLWGPTPLSLSCLVANTKLWRLAVLYCG